VISWAREADKLAFTYYEDGDYTIWTVDNPRLLKREPWRPPAAAPVVAAADGHAKGEAAPGAAVLPGLATAVDSADARRGDSASAGATSKSLYRTSSGFRLSDDTPQAEERGVTGGPVTVAELLDSASLALPDTTRFKTYDYRTRFSPDYIARPTIGYARDNYGRGVFGGTMIILSDLLGNSSLAFAGEVNGRISEARVFAGYTNLSRRLQYTTGIFQEPYFQAQGYTAEPTANGFFVEKVVYTRYLQRQAFGIGIYPLNRFTRFEYGLRLTNLDRTDFEVSQLVDPSGIPVDVPRISREAHGKAVYYASPSLAYVSDNTLFGLTGPIMGRRFRFEVQPTAGTYRWMGYLADYRRYDPILFNFLTVATRVMAYVNVGRDADSLRMYIGYPEVVRGYDRESYRVSAQSCGAYGLAAQYKCAPLFGSRIAVANAELRFPLLRRADLGIIPIGLPPIEGVTFFDAALAWFGGQKVSLRGYDPADGALDPSQTRHLLRSYGAGVRVNLFNVVLLRWDYAIPLDGPSRKNGYWRFSIAPSF
ncbi:MAG TPA: BamA/TamA family outer membrane protein, partial [Gemmatimonadaceae bacterium]|nr:BamA/TamA family outer membrane protein [Gemmatimonadaceae bacterium]